MDPTADKRRRERVRLLQKYLLNGPVKALTWPGLLPGHAVLETVGAKTGLRRRVVVGVNADDAGCYWVVAEQGRNAGYVANLTANPVVRLRVRGRWIAARAEAVPDDDVDARLARFPRAHARAVRRFGTRLLSVRVSPT